MKIHLHKIGFIVFIISVIMSCNSSVEPIQGKRKMIIKNADSSLHIKPKNKIVFNKEDLITKEIGQQEELQYYHLNTKKSLITWFCVTHTGYVKFKEGKLAMANNKIEEAQFEILMDSINDTDIDYFLMRETLVNTLKSSDFFDVIKYPTAIFTLSHLKKDQANSYWVAGDLQIKNIKKNISFKSTILQNDSSLMIISERFTIDRTLWDITIYSENYEQTDDSFLFTDMVDIKVVLWLEK